MSKKRTSAECHGDEQKNEGSTSLFQTDDNVKRARLNSLSDTTIQDLPIEVLECILVQAVVMDVKDLKMAKCVWKDKADLLIFHNSRLRTVCSLWASIFASNFFRNEVHRELDRTGQEPIRLEILKESAIWSEVRAMTALKDEIFLLIIQRNRFNDIVDYFIDVYDLSPLRYAKRIIPLPGIDPECIAACSVSNCVYLGARNAHHSVHSTISILRISKDEKQAFRISSWTSFQRLPISRLSISANGNLMFLSRQTGQAPDVVSIYNPNGALQHEITLPPDLQVSVYRNMMQKPNGNLVLAYATPQSLGTDLLEVDTSGSVVRHYQSSIGGTCFVNFADTCGRIAITKPGLGIELVDADFNLLDFFNSQQFAGGNRAFYDVHFERERNEVVHLYCDLFLKHVLVRYRFT